MLTESIQGLIDTFVDGLLATVRGASLEELTGGSPSKKRPSLSDAAALGRNLDPAFVRSKVKPGRLQRRSAEQIAALGVDAHTILVKHPDGLRSEQLRKEMGLDARELPRVLQQAIADGKIKILHGEKRATTYGAGGAKAKKVKVASKTTKKTKAKTAKKASRKPVSKKGAASKTAAA